MRLYDFGDIVWRYLSGAISPQTIGCMISIDLLFTIIYQITTMTSQLATHFAPKGNCTWRNLWLQLVSLHYHGSLARSDRSIYKYNMMIIVLLFCTKYFFGRSLIIRRTFDTQRFSFAIDKRQTDSTAVSIYCIPFLFFVYINHMYKLIIKKWKLSYSEHKGKKRQTKIKNNL